MSKADAGKKKKKSGESGLGKLVRIAEEMQKKYVDFREEWAKKFNDHIERFGRFVTASGQQIAGVSMNQQIHSNILEQLDVNIQAVDRAVREVFGRLEQVDRFLVKAGMKAEDLSQEELAEIKESAQDVYANTMKSCFKEVHEARDAAIKAQREQAKKNAEEAKKAAEEEAAAKEKETAEQELQNAENNQIVPEEPGEHASSYPEGAEIFGG